MVWHSHVVTKKSIENFEIIIAAVFFNISQKNIVAAKGCQSKNHYFGRYKQYYLSFSPFFEKAG